MGLLAVSQHQADTIPVIFSLVGPNDASTHTFSPREVTVIRLPSSSAPNLNAITKIPTISTDGIHNHFAVGDQGKVIKLQVTSHMNQIQISGEMTIFPEYNFTGVSFASENVGWIVGYKREGLDNWKGIILKTTDGGNNWTPQTSPSFPGNIAVPFLKVQAVTDQPGDEFVWISCGNGYVIYTKSGGFLWRLTHTKPLGGRHMGWFWGLHAIDSNTVWVCSDNSGLVAKTTNRGEDWECYKPGWEISPQDTSLIFNDCDALAFSSDSLFIAASNGKVVFTTNGGNSWEKYFPYYNIEFNYFFGIRCLFPDTPYVCGNYGIITRKGSINYPQLIHWWNDIDLKDFDLKSIGGYVKSDGSNYIIAVGEGSGIVFSCDSLQVISIVKVSSYSGSPVLIQFDLYNPSAIPYENYPISWWWSRYEADFGYGKSPRFYSSIDGYCDIPSGPGVFTFEHWTWPNRYPYLYQEMLYHLITRRDKGHHTSPNLSCATYTTGDPPPWIGWPAYMTVEDNLNDQGGIIRSDWGPPVGGGEADFYVVNHYPNYPFWTKYNGGLIGTTTNLFKYLPCPDGVEKWYYVNAAIVEGGNEFFSDHEISECITAIDNLDPPEIEGLYGDYCPELDACTLKWNSISPTIEPNLSGYWVCPDIGQDEIINHPAPHLPNYYIESVPAGHSRPFEWGFKVQAMDRSGKRGPFQQNYFRITVPRPPSTSPYATAFNQGGHLVRFQEDQKLHMAYETDINIVYSYSENNGENWYSEELSKGLFPCISVDQKGLPWVAFWRDGNIICSIKKPEGNWKEITVFERTGLTTWAGPPAIAMGTIPDNASPQPLAFAYITYTIYEGEEMPEMPAPQPYPSTHSFIKLSILNETDIVHYTIDEGDAEVPVSDPTVAVTPADLLHLVWQKGDEIWYITNLDQITYESWQSAQMQDKMNISDSPGTPSQHPCVESYGDKVYAAWREGKETDPGEILRRIRDINEDGVSSWGPKENISNSPDRESDCPVLATSDVVVYQEKIDNENYEIYAWINEDYVNLSETDKSSKYPHIVVEPPQPTQPEILIDAIWTEEIRTDTLYEVKFKRYIHPTNPEDMGEYLSVTTGDSIASPYCEHRDGFVQYGPYSLDYANSSLIYNLPYLHPKSNYLLKATVYHALTGRWREKLFSDSTLGADVYFNQYTPTVISILLPKGSYANDFAIRKEIQKFVGRFAVITDFKIYEVSLPDSGGGGAQSAGSERVLKTTLYQNTPNPFNTMTEISFGLAREGNVSFSIFDASGRMVRRLMNNRLKPGNYNLRWDGKDDMKKNLAQGVYFYRIKTEDYTATKKMTLLK
jgi:photosystem II stability/assembly factor-like uncharacterized protein